MAPDARKPAGTFRLAMPLQARRFEQEPCKINAGIRSRLGGAQRWRVIAAARKRLKPTSS